VPTTTNFIVVQGSDAAMHVAATTAEVQVAATQQMIASSGIDAPPVPLPSPLATPADVAGQPFGGVPVAGLLSSTQYSVIINRPGPSIDTGCVLRIDRLGSFTTR
jgi:hypothetical protein